MPFAFFGETKSCIKDCGQTEAAQSISHPDSYNNDIPPLTETEALHPLAGGPGGVCGQGLAGPGRGSLGAAQRGHQQILVPVAGVPGHRACEGRMFYKLCVLLCYLCYPVESCQHIDHILQLSVPTSMSCVRWCRVLPPD